jgi:DNA anti-recombination protein RmuC
MEQEADMSAHQQPTDAPGVESTSTTVFFAGTVQEPVATLPAPERQLAEIRDLLFGEQMRGIQSGVNALQRELLERIDTLSSRFTHHLEQSRRDINNRLDELNRRVDELNRLQENRLAASHSELGGRITSLRQDADRSDQTLQQQLQDMAVTLQESISNRSQELLERLNQTQVELRDSKADRKILANLLDRMATELNQDA